MRLQGFVLGLTLAVVGVGTVGCKEQAPPETPAGALEGSTYRNEYLGLTIVFPEDWIVQGEETNQRRRQIGVKMLAGDDSGAQAAIEAGQERTIPLFTVTQHPVGAPVPHNPSLSGTAESVAHAPGIRDGGDYLYHARRLLENAPIKPSFPRDVYTETVGGAEFHVLPFDVPLQGLTVHQEYYVTLRRGHAIVLALSFASEEERSALRAILGTLSVTARDEG
jgi:hypothetical protein